MPRRSLAPFPKARREGRLEPGSPVLGSPYGDRNGRNRGSYSDGFPFALGVRADTTARLAGRRADVSPSGDSTNSNHVSYSVELHRVNATATKCWTKIMRKEWGEYAHDKSWWHFGR